MPLWMRFLRRRNFLRKSTWVFSGGNPQRWVWWWSGSQLHSGCRWDRERKKSEPAAQGHLSVPAEWMLLLFGFSSLTSDFSSICRWYSEKFAHRLQTILTDLKFNIFKLLYFIINKCIYLHFMSILCLRFSHIPKQIVKELWFY